ncbi:hypothetical protein [Hyphomonas sp.]|uniref:hypothetical protein n=1 Tax=Hyphomonas sp. TaxID=87 RepID=UPI00352898C9
MDFGSSLFDPTTWAGALFTTATCAVIVGILAWAITPLRNWMVRQLVSFAAWLQGLANRVLGSEVLCVFADRRSMDAHLKRDFERTRNVFLLTGRGIQLQAEPPFAYLLNERNPAAHNVTVRILLPCPDASPDVIDWTAVNESYLRKIDIAYGEGTLSAQLAAAIKVLKSYQKDGRIEDVRLFNMPHFARIIITDSGVYVNPYNEERLSMRNRIVKFRPDSDTGRLWRRLFDLLWTHPHT